MELAVDSRPLQALTTSVKEPEERYSKVDLAAIRESFDNGALYAIQWCAGKEILPDALTECNAITATRLLQALSSWEHQRPAETITNHGSTSS